jgi:hypothetical protein
MRVKYTDHVDVDGPRPVVCAAGNVHESVAPAIVAVPDARR